MTPPLRPYLTRIAGGDELTRAEAAEVMGVLLRGEASPEETAGLLVGLASRGETVDELTGFAEAMRAYAVSVDCPDPDAVDLCGTGGDLSHTFNVSTAASFVVAGAGVTVAKHGNRSVSSLTGSADVLEALGVQVGLGKAGVEFCLRETGLAFLFAPNFHPALRHVMPVRRALGVRTAFNLLGPLCNPAGVRRQLVGCFRDSAARKVAGILAGLGTERALAVWAVDGLDEASPADVTRMYPVDGSRTLHATSIAPETFGLPRHSLEDIRGGSATDNAQIIRNVLDGRLGAPRDAVLMNAALGLFVSGRHDDPADAFAAAVESVDTGRAKAKLADLVAASCAAPVA